MLCLLQVQEKAVISSLAERVRQTRDDNVSRTGVVVHIVTA